jgi:hypothetical protein
MQEVFYRDAVSWTLAALAVSCLAMPYSDGLATRPGAVQAAEAFRAADAARQARGLLRGSGRRCGGSERVQCISRGIGNRRRDADWRRYDGCCCDSRQRAMVANEASSLRRR